MKKSISFWSFAGKSAPEAMRLAKAAGFDGIELTLDAADSLGLTPQTTDAQLQELKKQAADMGLCLPSVASSLYWADSFTADDAAERKRAHDTAVCQIRQAAALGADTVLVVPGSVAVEFVPQRAVVPYDVCWERALTEMRALRSVAEEYKVAVGIENVWNQFLLSPLEMRAFIDAVGGDYIGSYFDVGNVLYSGYPEHWIRILGSRIRKVHFKDYRRNPGGLNAFVDLLSGDVNWPEVMRAFGDIGYDGWVTGEMLPPYAHAADQIIMNTAASMDRIITSKF